jgi:hypothetical protein
MANDEDWDDDSENGEASDAYLFEPHDEEIVAAAVLLLEKIIRSPLTKPAQIVSVAKVLHVFRRLPKITTGITVSVGLIGPRRWFGDHEIFHCWDVNVEESALEVTSTGRFYRASTGGDSFTIMGWNARPGWEPDLSDYLAHQWMVDDAQPFEQDVVDINLSKPGYSLEVADEQNPLLGKDDDEAEE